jgi:Cytochrome P450
MSTYTVIFISSAIAATLSVTWWLFQRSEPDLPPLAPGCLPVIGHLLALTSKEPLQKLFLKWSQEVGPMFTLKLGVKRWIIINDIATVKELIVNRGTIYSSRDISSVMVDGIFDGGMYDRLSNLLVHPLTFLLLETGGGFAFYEYGKYWRNLRRIGKIPSIWTTLKMYISSLHVSVLLLTTAECVLFRSSLWVDQKENR